MVNLELYRIFKVVAEQENLTRASEILLISQPAVTKHIKNLENELNVQLFIRSKYGMILNENGKKYPLIVDSFNYFVGMCENAIAYFNSIIIDEDYKYVISHKIIKWDDSVEVLYNPINITFDYQVRDVAEYIKNSFFGNNSDIFDDLVVYLKYNHLSLIDVRLLVSRLLYPSFYFEMYEDILIDNKEEKILLDVISRIDDYEEYLDKIISFFKIHYDIDEIMWLKKNQNFDK